jgi:hypothetical protein
MRAEQMLLITNHTAIRPGSMVSLQFDPSEQMLQISNHRASKRSSMQFPAVLCVRADATDH